VTEKTPEEDGREHEDDEAEEELFEEQGYYSLQSPNGFIHGEADVTPLQMGEDDEIHDYMIQFKEQPAVREDDSPHMRTRSRGTDAHQMLEFVGPNKVRKSRAQSMTKQSTLFDFWAKQENPQTVPYSVALVILVFSLAVSNPAMALTGALLLITTKLHYGAKLD